MISTTETLIKEIIDLAVNDLKNNLWLVEDILSDFIENPILSRKFGMKEIDRCKEWLTNNKIHYFQKLRQDSEQFPCVTISMGESFEDKSLTTLGDATIDVIELDPSSISKPIAYIVKPFQVVSYNQATGIVKIPNNTDGAKYISEGQIAVDPETGNGYVILEKKSSTTFKIEPGTELDVDSLAIIPKYQMYRARREGIITQETFNIGCHVHGDPSTLLFLFAIVKYALLRYREGLLEYNNFQLSSLRFSDMIKNDAFGADNVYSRFVVLSGQVEESWLKTPYRVVEAIDFTCREALDGSIGLNILSNLDTSEDTDEADNGVWRTKKDN